MFDVLNTKGLRIEIDKVTRLRTVDCGATAGASKLCVWVE
jgi:hypothetical protein